MAILKPLKRSVSTAVLGLMVLLLMGGGYAAWSYYDAPPVARYQPVVAMLAAGTLPITGPGIVDLSKKFPGMTPKDIVYAVRRDDGSFLAVFPTYFGEGTEMAGLLYTSRPLQDDDVHHRISAIHFDQQLIDVGGYGNLLLEKRINPSWYHVSYKLH